VAGAVEVVVAVAGVGAVWVAGGDYCVGECGEEGSGCCLVFGVDVVRVVGDDDFGEQFGDQVA
jgi:hypothetical protein